MPALTAAEGWFVDRHGRRVILRGVNLGGSSKVPATPPGATHLPGSLNPAEPISFIGRPFPLAEADEHFGRLRHWGFNVVRLVTTWEALEHAGPGQYDEAYLAWLAELVARAGDYGLFVFIDFHQDTWGRWSGGDGAPYWTYTLAGLNPATFDAAEAAVTMQRRMPAYQPMGWTVNAGRFAARTMTTLFLGSADFAPAALVEGEPLQHVLQRHFLAAAARVASALCHLPHVLGYGFLNELGAGYIGTSLETPNRTLVSGPQLTGFDGMVLAAGLPRRVPHALALGPAHLPAGTRVLNQDGARAWQPGATDLWQAASVWAPRGGEPVLLRPDHFLRVAGRAVHPHRDYLEPLARRFAAAVQAAHPGAMIFVENGILGQQPDIRWGESGITGLVNATHWYDAVTLFRRRPIRRWSFDVYRGRLVLGKAAVRQMFADQLGRIKAASRELMGNCPTLIAEFGIPFDMPGLQRRRRAAYRDHETLLASYYDALDAHLLSATQWNYTADNNHRWGDQWNREDLSIYSRDDAPRGDDGARALRGFCRPYARVIAGTPALMTFDPESGAFELRYRPDRDLTQPTEIFVPRLHYPAGYTVLLSSGHAQRDDAQQLVRVWAATSDEQIIVIRRAP